MKNIFLSFILVFFAASSLAQGSDKSPQVVFGNLTHEGPYDRSEILVQDKLTVSSKDKNTYEIASYHCIISPATGKPIRFEVKGYKLPIKLQGALNQIVGGDKIVIESAFARVNGDPFDLVQLKPITLEVKKYKNEGPYGLSNPSEDKPIMDSLAKVILGNIDLSVPVAKEDIIKQTKVNVISSNELNYQVTGFKMIVAFKNDPAIMMASSGNLLTSKMKEVLSTRLNSGDRVIIEGIRAKAIHDGIEIKANLSPVVFTVH